MDKVLLPLVDKVCSQSLPYRVKQSSPSCYGWKSIKIVFFLTSSSLSLSTICYLNWALTKVLIPGLGQEDQTHPINDKKHFDENKCSSHLAGPESFVDGLFSPFQLGKRVHNIGKNEGGTNCVMKIGGLRARGRKFFLLCDRGIFFMQLFYYICYY